MKILLYVLGGLLVLVVLLVGGLIGAIAYSEYSVSTPLTRAIDERVDRRWGDLVPITPDPLAPQSSRAEIVELLAADEFERDYGTDWGVFQHPYRAQLDSGMEMYVRHEDHVICRYAFYVLLRFDDSDRLTSAVGTARWRGCL